LQLNKLKTNYNRDNYNKILYKSRSWRNGNNGHDVGQNKVIRDELSISHTRKVVRERCKGDEASQWKSHVT